MRSMSLRLSLVIISLLLMFITTYAYSDTTPTPTPEPTPEETPTITPKETCTCPPNGYIEAQTRQTTNITSDSAILNGFVQNNYYGWSWEPENATTTAWFTYWAIYTQFAYTESEYGDGELSTQINNLKPSTIYFYYINAHRYGILCCESWFDESTVGEIKTFSTAPILPDKGSIAGRTIEYYPLEGVGFATIRIIGRKTRIDMKTTSDENGYFAFNYLDPDDYTIIVTKKGYKRTKEKVKLEAGENEYTEIILKKL